MSLPENTAHDVNATVGLALAVIFPLSALIGSAFWNRGTTLEVHTTTLAISSALIALPVGLRSVYHWFKPREKLDPPPHWNLKTDSLGTWVVTAIGVAVIHVACIVFGLYLLMSVLAQHVDGSTLRVPAQVEEVQTFSSRKVSCRARVQFRGNWDRSFTACVIPSFGSPLTELHLQVGDAVVVNVSDNAFGTAVVGIELRNREHAQQTAARDRVKKRGA